MGGLGSEVGPAEGAGAISTSWKPWPEHGGAEVSFLAGEQMAAERIAGRFFKRLLEPWEYAGLAGAPDGARVEVGASGGQLYIEMGDPVAAAYRAHFYVRRAKTWLVIVNDGFRIALYGLRRRGLGLCVLCRQVATAAALGVDRIELVAGRRRDENGYYAWPRFGFDGALPARLRKMLPIDLDRARTLLDLMECPQGRAWWREHGATIRAAFDLSAGSRSRAALDRYVRGRINSAGGLKTNLEISAAMLYGNAR